MFKTISINKKTGRTVIVKTSDNWEKMVKLAERCTFCESNRDVIYLAMHA